MVIEPSIITALAHYGLEHSHVKKLGTGLINRTWLITQHQVQYTLQQVNPMFPVSIHKDIAKVTSHLKEKGLLTPELIPGNDGGLFCEDNNGVWRLYSYVDGDTHNKVNNPDIAFEAGTLLGIFHCALHELDYDFSNSRPGIHDTRKHLLNLESSLEKHQSHFRYQDILPLAREILGYADQFPVLIKTASRKVHGDPKINNFLFDKLSGKGLCLLDFDTLSNMQICFELGDALRSWCNPLGENKEETSFSIENLVAGLEGYVTSSGNLLAREELNSILPATQIIYIELAARFCADALQEDYFAWDSSKFNSHSEHSQIRAMGQLCAYKSLLEQYADAKRILSKKGIMD